MTWVRYDDNVANHPKVAPLDDATYRLWREAIEWCAHNLTDGVIRAHQLGVTSVRASKPRATRLVQSGLWHTAAGEPCQSGKCPPPGPDGWAIHDYWDYQPTRLKVREEQAAKAERQRRWLDAQKAKKADGQKDGNRDASQDALKDAPPSPPRPAPKEAGAGPPQSLPAAGGGRAAAGSAGQNSRPSRPCPTCANSLTSAYHRNVCAKAAA